MEKDTARWREYMTEQEADELEWAAQLRASAAKSARSTTKRIKDRCVKRMIRAEKKEAKSDGD